MYNVLKVPVVHPILNSAGQPYDDHYTRLMSYYFERIPQLR